MALVKPPRLRPGDRIATVSLSWGGPGAIPHRYEAGKRQLMEAFEVEVVEMPHALADPQWVQAHPEARAADLMQAFEDPSINGIFSTIGGDDSIRILRHLDLDVIRNNPKVFMGYSDTTVTHFACYRAGLTSYYGPSIMAGFGENAGLFPYMVESVRRTLFATEPVGIIEPNRDGWTVERLDWAETDNQERKRVRQPSTGWRWLQGEGTVRGRLIGGCIEVVDWLRGTPVWLGPEAWRGAILFLETSEEAPPPQAVARALRVYAAMGILREIAAILFGRPGGEVPVEEFEQYDEAILEVVAREEGLTNIPIITRMDFGHTDPMFVLPYGIEAEIECDRQRFSIVEAAVSDG